MRGTIVPKRRIGQMPAKGWRGFERNQQLADIKMSLAHIDSKVKGTVAEGYVSARLAELGFDVWFPYMNNHKCDLAIHHNGRLIRIQVKSAGFDVRSDRFRSVLTTRDKNGKHIKYDPRSQDFFIIKCEGVWVFYVIPSHVGVEHHSLNFYPHRDRVFLRSFDAEVYRDGFDLIKNYDPR
jgi:hypothetical protein